MSGVGWGKGEPYLERLPPGRHQLPRDLVHDHQRRRILNAALDVFAERGFAAATVKDLIRGAGVSRATFYEIFPDKEACAAALHREILAWLSEQVTAALVGPPDWHAQVRAGVEKSVELLSENPRLATLCAVEAPMTRLTSVRSQHERLVAEICRGLRMGRTEGKDLPRILEPALVSGAVYLIGRSIGSDEGPEAPTLGAELAELMLVPYSR